MNPRRMKRALLPFIGLAIAAGCDHPELTATAPPGEGAETPAVAEGRSTLGAKDLLVEVKIDDNRSVKFYQMPASILVVEELGADHRFLADPALHGNVLELYRSLRPGATIPAALQEGYDRARLAASTLLQREVAPSVPSGGQPASQAVTAAAASSAVSEIRQGQIVTAGEPSSSNPATFANNGFCDSSSGIGLCRLAWANGFHSGTHNSTNMSCIVDNFAGNGLLVLIGENSSAVPESQSVHTNIAYVDFGNTVMTRYCQVSDASGDSFHIATRWF
jgi:hypothetical protein